MTKKEFIKRLCALVSNVNSNHFHNGFASDCFCGESPLSEDNPIVSELVIKFIEDAVKEKIEQDPTEIRKLKNQLQASKDAITGLIDLIK